MAITLAAALGTASAARATNVMWYGTGCTDEGGAPLANGDLVQLIRSQDGTVGAPDPVTGAPTGGDAEARTTTYVYPESPDNFQGEDWSETEGYYVCVRIWNGPNAASATHYYDSSVRQATGVLPVDIDCSGARTDTPKQGAAPTATQPPTETPTSPPTPTALQTATPTPIVTGAPPGVTPTATPPVSVPTATPGRDGSPIDIRLNAAEYAPEAVLVVTADVEPIAGAFDAYLVVVTPDGVLYSFTPQGARASVTPYAQGVPALPSGWRGGVVKMTVPRGIAAGGYVFHCAAFPAGRAPGWSGQIGARDEESARVR